MKHYPHHIRDFNNATRHLTRLERSVYRDLIELYYDTESPISLDIPAVCRLILARTNEESTAVEQALNEFFTETPAGYFHERCDAEIEAYQANTSQRAMAGKASAEAKRLRKLQALNEQVTTVEQPLNERSTTEQQAFNETSTNQSTNQPINQEPREEVSPRKRSAQPVFEIPEWINGAHWDAWHSCPKRKKATPQQKQLSVDKLNKWREAGQDHAGALENAAVGGWAALFLPDAQKAGKQAESFRESDQKAAARRFAAFTGQQPAGNVIDITPKTLEIEA